MPTKKRILMCNDAHFLYTGYGKYGKQVLSRLHATGKYEIAELACYGEIDDKANSAPWRYYPNAVNSNHPLFQQYQSHPQNEFGSWRFERTCLDFKPDIVIDIRDPWMMSFVIDSALRPFYHLAIMPTVDSEPQQDSWIELFSQADGVFTYSEYGLDVLNKQSQGKIKTQGTAPPGVDLEAFAPSNNKEELRKQVGFGYNINVIGTIMRNQSRKLYPDLFETFRKFIDKCYATDKADLAKNTYLYVHCSYPDVGWEIPALLIEHGISRKVVFTYICQTCNNVFCNFFRGPRSVCNRCNAANAMLPNTTVGLTPDQLNTVLNLFDVYVQYSVCEGFGMPQVEAASCGVPVMSVNYSAMEDIVNNCHGIALPVQRMYRDLGIGAYRALPDNNKSAEVIYDFLRQPAELRRMRGNKARKSVEKNYNWDRTAKIWENYFDSIELTGLQGQWDSSPRNLVSAPPLCPQEVKGFTNAYFVEWLLANVLAEPTKINTRFANQLIKDLNFGARRSGRAMEIVSKDSLYQQIKSLADEKLLCEQIRTGMVQPEPLDFIQFANEREKFV